MNYSKICGLIILGFLTGQLLAIAANETHCGSNDLKLTFFGAIFSVIICLVNKKKFKSRTWRRGFAFLIIVMSFCWGYIHQSKSIPQSLSQSTILDSAREVFQGQNKWICVVQDSEVYYSRGSQRTGAIGHINFTQTKKLIKPVNTYFVLNSSAETKLKKPFLDVLGFSIRESLTKRLDRLEPKLNRWYSAILLGKYGSLLNHEKDVFVKTGTVHLLVVSGLHVGLFSFFINVLLLFPFWMLYSAGVLSSNWWVNSKNLVSILGSLSSIIYVLAVGFPFAAQRALLIFIVHRLSPIFFGLMPTLQRLSLTFTLQILIFPDLLFSNSMLLSWGAYLCVIFAATPIDSSNKNDKTMRPSKFFAFLIGIFKIQVALSILMVAIFGNLSVIGCALNIVVVPLFTLVFGLALLSSAFQVPIYLEALIASFQYKFLELIEINGALVHKYRWLYVEEIGPTLRVFCAALLIFLGLTFFRNKTIRS